MNVEDHQDATIDGRDLTQEAVPPHVADQDPQSHNHLSATIIAEEAEIGVKDHDLLNVNREIVIISVILQ